MSLKIRYTGHPLLDAGVATLVAAAKVNAPEAVTHDQIQKFIEDILLPTYINPAMSNYLGAVVYANVNFANPGMNTKPKFDAIRRDRLAAWFTLGIHADPTDREALLALIDSFRQGKRSEWLLPADVEPPDENERCTFSGDLAVIRVSRVIIPMIGSEDAVNFVPDGRPRLPVAGWVLLALLAMPMGTLNSGGQILLVHTMDTKLLQQLAAYHLSENRSVIQMEGIKKRPNFRFARTQLMKALVDLNWRWAKTYPLTIYRFSSAAQSARVEMHTLESRVIKFITRAKREAPRAWDQVVARAWHMDAPPNAIPEVNDKGEQTYERRNYFYEDLFSLPYNANAFLRRYLLRRRRPGSPSGKQKQDPRFHYSSSQDREVISWRLTELFMEVMMDISKERVQAIRDLGDRIADYIQRHDARLYQRMYVLRKPHALRRVLLQADNSAKSQGLGALLPYDEFMQVFFYEDEHIMREDWFLAQDLLMIRIIEQLTPEWVSANADLLDEAEDSAPKTELEDV